MARVLALLAIVVMGPSAPSGASRAAAHLDRARSRTAAYQEIRFEENRGQFDDDVCFALRGADESLYLTRAGSVTVMTAAQPRSFPVDAFRKGMDAVDEPAPRCSAVRMDFVGASNASSIEGIVPVATRTAVIKGADASRWRSNLRSFRSVRYTEVYPGIDLVYYGGDAGVEYDFVVAPGADVSSISMRFRGAQSVEIDGDGSLALRTECGDLRHRPPRVFQRVDGAERAVAGRFTARGDVVGFEIGEFDHSLPLVVDPVLAFSAFVGGRGLDVGQAIAVRENAVYVAGYTLSDDFPVRGSLGPYAGGLDVFVLELQGSSPVPVYSTFIGGAGTDTATGIAIGANGRAFVTGYTNSQEFPLVSPIMATSESFDAFVLELDETGSELMYSTLLGGAGDDFGYGIALDATGAAYVAGATSSADFPTKTPIRLAQAPPDGFVTKIDPSGTSIVYSTYLGGDGPDLCTGGIAVDTGGNAYVTGQTSSLDFPVKDPIKPYFGILNDLFVSELDPSGSALVYSTYLGGEFDDAGLGIAVDDLGAAYVCGTTKSVSFPKVDGTRHGDETDAFVLKVAPLGVSVAYALPVRTLIPEVARSIAVDAAGRAYVVGFCTSPDFPTKDPVQIPFGAQQDAFVLTVDPAGSSLLFSSKLGGRIQDDARAIAVTPDGVAYVTGSTASVDFPVAGPTLTSLHQDEDVFVLRVDPGDGPPAPSVKKVKTGGAGKAFALTIRGSGFAPGATVYVSDDAVAWPRATVKATKIKIVGGGDLQAKLPVGTAVRVRIVNPDGGAAFASIVRAR